MVESPDDLTKADIADDLEYKPLKVILDTINGFFLYLNNIGHIY